MPKKGVGFSIAHSENLALIHLYGQKLIDIEYAKEGQIYKESLKAIDDHDRQDLPVIREIGANKVRMNNQQAMVPVFVVFAVVKACLVGLWSWQVLLLAWSSWVIRI